MGRFVFLATLAVVFLSCRSAPETPAADAVPEAVDARALHDRILTFDAEMDYPPDFMEGAKDAGTTAI